MNTNSKITKIRTTDEAISHATERLVFEISDLGTKREDALSVFRQTATDLDNINCELRGKISYLDKLDAFIEAQRSTTARMIEDNDSVRKAILSIIGE